MTNELYLGLSACVVFRSVLEKPIMANLMKALSATAVDERLSSYSAFVSEIYGDQRAFPKIITDLVLTDENPYIKARALGRQVNPYVEAQAKRELELFAKICTLKGEDILSGVSVPFIAEYSTYEVDIKGLYEQRIKNIGRYGYGIFSTATMFSIDDCGDFYPVQSPDRISLSHFVGYNNERAAVYQNTKALIDGKSAENVLLVGDAGTGKSSTVKAVANHFADEGLRLIEVPRDKISLLKRVMEKIGENPLKFIIFIDDLSIERCDSQFSLLKAELEGSCVAKRDNVVIYATSNRRHIVRESFEDREGNEIHRNDTIEESLSLFQRFGLVVSFGKPTKALYLEIARELAKREGIPTDEHFDILAEAFALRRGSRSSRCAEQFVNSLVLQK